MRDQPPHENDHPPEASARLTRRHAIAAVGGLALAAGAVGLVKRHADDSERHDLLRTELETAWYRDFGDGLLTPLGNPLQANIFATPLMSSGDTLFAATIDPAGRPAVVRRAPDGAIITGQVSPTAIGRDAHNVASLGIDRAGFIHVAWGMHDVPLHYARSNAPGDIATWTRVDRFTGRHEDQVTYPQFYRDPVDGRLLALHRNGRSSAGTLHLSVYDEDVGWSPRDGIDMLIDGEGRRGPYPNTLGIDRDGNIALTWTFRERLLNRDIFCARYLRGERKWVRRDGTAYTLPITRDTADRIVATAPRLINQCSSWCDAAGTLHIAFAMDDVAGRSQIWHNAVAPTGAVVTSQATNLAIPRSNPRFADLSRPLIFPGPEGNLALFFTTGGTSLAADFINPPGIAMIVQSTDGLVGAQWGPPRTIFLPQRVSEANLDLDWLLRTGMPRLYMQVTEPGAASTPVYVLTRDQLLAMPEVPA